MATTYQLIQTYQLTTTTASVTFSSIPQTYQDLIVRFTARTNTADTNVNMNTIFNGATTTLYSGIQQSYYSSAPNYNLASGQASINQAPWAAGANITTSSFAGTELYISNYTSTTWQKQVYGLAGIVSTGTGLGWAIDSSNLWRGTSAISSITLTPYSGSLLSGSNFYLYGIKNS
jgi:hypothetical protein